MTKRVAASLCMALVPELMPLAADSKCRSETYEITGTITNGKTRQPVDEASVLVFLDQYEQAFGQKQAGDAPDRTSRNGRFVLQGQFDTLKSYSFLLGHNCSARPESIAVFILKDGYVPLRKTHLKKEFSIQPDGERRLIQIPNISLRPIP